MTTTNYTSPVGDAHAQPLDPARICSKKDESIIEATLKKHYGTCFTQQEVQFARELVSSLRMPADAPISRASDKPVGEDAVNEAIAALQRLENACDKIAALRTQEQYLSMVDGAQQDALLDLDSARMAARVVLASPANGAMGKREALADAIEQMEVPDTRHCSNPELFERGFEAARSAAASLARAANGAIGEREAAKTLVQRHANAARALEHMYTEKNIARLKAISEELEAALTAEKVAAEPVAWRYKHGEESEWRYGPTRQNFECVEPLYAAPQPAQTAQPATLSDEQVGRHVRRIQELMIKWINVRAGEPAQRVWDEIERELSTILAASTGQAEDWPKIMTAVQDENGRITLATLQVGDVVTRMVPADRTEAMGGALSTMRNKIAAAPRRQFESAPGIYTNWLDWGSVLDVIDAEIDQVNRDAAKGVK